MTISKKSAVSASEILSRRAEAVHTGSALSPFGKPKPRRYLYAGMLFPSSVVAGREIEKLDDRPDSLD